MSYFLCMLAVKYDLSPPYIDRVLTFQKNIDNIRFSVCLCSCDINFFYFQTNSFKLMYVTLC
jgi:hypothetical protein